MLDFVTGLDLGQQADFTALVTLERTWEDAGAVYLLRHAERFELGTSYTKVVERLRDLFDARPRGEAYPPLAGSVLVADQTGVGVAVLDMLRDANLNCELRGVLITGGYAITYEGGTYHTPKRNWFRPFNCCFNRGDCGLRPCPCVAYW